MSKNKAKAKKAVATPKKRAAVKTKKKAARRAVSGGVAPSQRTSAATIFVYKTDDGYRVRTSPQLLSCPPGSIEWTVVNLTSDPMPDVDITWPSGGPWGNAPIPIRGGNVRKSLEGAQPGRFKYDVTCNGFTEDPEVEWPEM
jgi:hypothetical protein